MTIDNSLIQTGVMGVLSGIAIMLFTRFTNKQDKAQKERTAILEEIKLLRIGSNATEEKIDEHKQRLDRHKARLDQHEFTLIKHEEQLKHE